jgi:hypothetical protein
MDTLILSRLQFAVATYFHFLFVPLTLGLSLLTAIMETLPVRISRTACFGPHRDNLSDMGLQALRSQDAVPGRAFRRGLLKREQERVPRFDEKEE